LLLCAALLLPGISAGEVEAAHPISSGFQLAVWSGDAIWLVDTLADSGPGSLREALAGAAAGDRIEFDAAVFPPETPGTILVLSELPRIRVNGLTIDAVGRGVILDGGNLPPDLIDGLWILADHITIQGLQVLRFPQYGISIEGAEALIGWLVRATWSAATAGRVSC
jgi:hypothetical protein